MYKIKVNSAHTFDVTKESLEELDTVKSANNNYHILQLHIVLD